MSQFDYRRIVPNRRAAYGWISLGVQANVGEEFKRAIWTANQWGKHSKGIKSFDILQFTPTTYAGFPPVPLFEHSGFARFIAVYYKNKSGAFPMGIDPYAR